MTTPVAAAAPDPEKKPAAPVRFKLGDRVLSTEEYDAEFRKLSKAALAPQTTAAPAPAQK